jgi:hypothetical protein
LSTVPTPVMTAHPVMAATSGGTSAGTGITARSETIAYCAKHDTPIRWCTCSPSGRCSRVVPSWRPPELAWMAPDWQSPGRPLRQNRQ